MNRLNKKIKVLFIGAGEPTASSRYRAAQFVEFHGRIQQSSCRFYFFGIQPRIYYMKSTYLYALIMIIRKIWSLFLCLKYDIIFMQRNPVKIFSPYYEWIISNVLKKKIIFDFDDNLWFINGKYDLKIDRILKIVNLVIVGNKYLKEKALKFNSDVLVIPTVLDIEKIPTKKISEMDSEYITICWSGSCPGNIYLSDIEDALVRIQMKYSDKIHFVFVSDVKPVFSKFSNFEFVQWSKDAEKHILNAAQIGIMPLLDDEISKAKCGFKLIIYSAYSLALVASPIGVNKEIVIQGENGFYARNTDDWVESLSCLIDDPHLLNTCRRRSRVLVEKNYSIIKIVAYLEGIILNLSNNADLEK